MGIVPQLHSGFKRCFHNLLQTVTEVVCDAALETLETFRGAGNVEL